MSTTVSKLKISPHDPFAEARPGGRHSGPPGWGHLSSRTREALGGLALAVIAATPDAPALEDQVAMFQASLRSAWSPDFPTSGAALPIESQIAGGEWRRAELESCGPTSHSATLVPDLLLAIARQQHAKAGKR